MSRGAASEPSVVLKAGRDRSLRRRHPWVFSGAVAATRGAPQAGDTVVVAAADGEVLGRAAYNPASSIVCRMWTFDAATPVDEELVIGRLDAALAGRDGLAERWATNALRWVYAESDRLPGLIVDRYGTVAVAQFLAPGVERFREAILDRLAARPEVAVVVERSDGEGRKREGLAPSVGTRRGVPSDDPLEITEAGWRFAVDPRHGHKTGFYLDQRESRRLVAEVASDRRVLNLFGYTGGFSVAAARGGAASVVTVDSSAPALALAAVNLAANGVAGELVEADVFTDLRRRRDAGERFDLVIVDPPKLAASEAQVNRATRAYKDLNWLACRLLTPGGLLVTFSCSAAVDAVLFQKVVFGASLDAGVDLQLVGRLAQPADHPVLLSVPETEYLKGLVCRVS